MNDRSTNSGTAWDDVASGPYYGLRLILQRPSQSIAASDQILRQAAVTPTSPVERGAAGGLRRGLDTSKERVEGFVEFNPDVQVPFSLLAREGELLLMLPDEMLEQESIAGRLSSTDVDSWLLTAARSVAGVGLLKYGIIGSEDSLIDFDPERAIRSSDWEPAVLVVDADGNLGRRRNDNWR